MKKDTIIGIGVIAVAIVLFVWVWWNLPAKQLADMTNEGVNLSTSNFAFTLIFMFCITLFALYFVFCPTERIR